VDRHSGLYEFNRSALCRDVSCPQLFAKFPPLLLVLAIALFQLLPKIHDHRWGPEQRPISKLTALLFLKARVVSPQSDKLTQDFVCFFPIHASISLFHLPSLANITPRYMNWGTFVYRLWSGVVTTHTQPCRSPTPIVNGCDSTPPTNKQTLEYSDLAASYSRPLTPYSLNTPRNVSRKSLSYATARTKTALGILQNWLKYFAASLFKALGIHYSIEAEESNATVFSTFTPGSNLVHMADPSLRQSFGALNEYRLNEFTHTSQPKNS